MKNGMKQTEIGEIPVEWEVRKLEDICTIQIGGTPSRSNDNYWDKKGETQNHWVAISDLKSRFITSTKEKISELGIRNSNCKIVPKFTVLMSFKLSIGKMAYAGVELYTNEAIAAFIADKKQVDNSFLYYILPTLERETDVAVKGETLNKAKLLKTRLALPPLAEQRKIAEILSTLDEKMAVMDEQLAQTQELKKGLMQRLLTKGIGHTQFKDSPLGEIPASWEVKLLDEVTKRGSGHTPSKNFPEYYNGGIKWVSLADSNRLDNGWIKETKTNISNLGIKNSSATLHPKGTVLLSRDAGIGKSAVMHEDMAVSQHFITWTCNGKISNWFLYYYLQLNKPLFERIAAGSTIKTIGLPFFKKFSIPVPTIFEQEKIAEILTTVDEKIGVLQDKKVQYQTLKRGLMQQLLTGQRRVRVPALETAALV